MAKHDKKNRHKAWTIQGTIVGASRVQDFTTQKGRKNQCAMIHVQESAEDDCSQQVAVKVTGELCNYVGCVGARVAVDYVIRVFEFVKNGATLLANDIYATQIRMM